MCSPAGQNPDRVHRLRHGRRIGRDAAASSSWSCCSACAAGAGAASPTCWRLERRRHARPRGCWCRDRDLRRAVPRRALCVAQAGLLLSDLAAILRHHHVSLPADLSLLVKAFITLEGMGRELDPTSTWRARPCRCCASCCTSAMHPLLLRRHRRRARAGVAAGRTALQDLPRLLRAARKAGSTSTSTCCTSSAVGNQPDRAVNRLVIRSRDRGADHRLLDLLTVPQGPQWLGTLGFLTALLGSLWLILSIWGANRRDRDDD